MGMRIARYISNRTVSDDETKTLMIMPIWQHEKSVKLSISGVSVTLASHPAHELASINYYGLFVPWRVIQTYMEGAETVNLVPETVAEWDERIEQLLLDDLGGVNEYQERSTGDRVGDVVADAGDDSPKADGTVYLGPSGVSRFFSRETFMTPWGSDGVNQTRKWDLWTIDKPLSYGSGILAIVVKRENFIPKQQYSVSPTTVTKKAAQALLKGGDLGRVNEMIQYSDDDIARYMREHMFEGDRYIGSDLLSDHEASCYIKGALTVSTPYSVKR